MGVLTPDNELEKYIREAAGLPKKLDTMPQQSIDLAKGIRSEEPILTDNEEVVKQAQKRLGRNKNVQDK
ncbi:MAG: hypothetical protein U9N81_13450 [Bacillota bacterium]|nr:hypothetical protein [Bacillota bacterium]